MMVIHFKNGTTREVSQEIAHIIRNNLTSQTGAKQWQAINDEDGDLILLLNLHEVVHLAHKINP